MTRAAWVRRRLLGTLAAAGASGPAAAAIAAESAPHPGAAIDVRQFGAKGDGRTDDAPAINRAIQALRERQMRAGPFAFVPELKFSGGIYAADSPINLTRLQALNAVIAGNGAVILGRCRDQPVIDALGARWLTIRDLTIVGDHDATPKLGLQLGRLADGRVADNHRLANVKFVGHYTLACLLNFAAETTGFDHVFCWNDRPDPESFCVIQDGLDHFNAVSAFVPNQHAKPDQDTSFNENEFINCDFRHGGGGVPVWLGDTSRHRFYRCYTATAGRASFVLYCGRNGHTMLDIDCHCEARGLRHVFEVTGRESTVLHGFSYKDHGIFASEAVFARAAPMRHVEVQHARIEMGHFFEPGCRVLDDPSGWTMTGEAYLAEPKFWNAGGRFVGTLFLGARVYSTGVRNR